MAARTHRFLTNYMESGTWVDNGPIAMHHCRIDMFSYVFNGTSTEKTCKARSVDVVSRGCRPDPILKTGLCQHVSTVGCCLFKTALMPVGPFAPLVPTPSNQYTGNLSAGQTSHQRFAAHQNNWWLNDWKCFFPHSELGWVSNATWITISDFWLDVHPSQYDRQVDNPNA